MWILQRFLFHDLPRINRHIGQRSPHQHRKQAGPLRTSMVRAISGSQRIAHSSKLSPRSITMHGGRGCPRASTIAPSSLGHMSHTFGRLPFIAGSAYNSLSTLKTEGMTQNFIENARLLLMPCANCTTPCPGKYNICHVSTVARVISACMHACMVV